MPTYTHEGGEIIAYACSKNSNTRPCPALVFQSSIYLGPPSTCSLMEIKCKQFEIPIFAGQGSLFSWTCTSAILYCNFFFLSSARILKHYTNRPNLNLSLESRCLQHNVVGFDISKSAALRYSSIEPIRAICYRLTRGRSWPVIITVAGVAASGASNRNQGYILCYTRPRRSVLKRAGIQL